MKGEQALIQSYQEVMAKVGDLARVWKRPLPQVVVVTKTYPIEDIQTLYRLGHRDFGENRVQELKEKSLQLNSWPERGDSPVRWHYLGRIQSNKIKDLLGISGLSYIHSVESLRTLEGLFKVGETLVDRINPMGLFLQVNTSGEAEKQGPQDLSQLLELARAFSSADPGPHRDSRFPFQLSGLMTIGTHRTTDFESEARRCFTLLRSFRDMIGEGLLRGDLKLSMGMSTDYPLAVELGADVLRIGSSILGPRDR